MRRFDVLILSFIVAVLVAALGVVSWQSIRGAESLLLPALDENADVVGRSLAGLVGEAIGYGIELDEIVGAEAVMSDILKDNEEFGFVALVAADGATIASSVRDAAADGGQSVAALSNAMRTVSEPVMADGREVASVVIGIPNLVARTLLRSISLDMAILLLVSFLVALQLLSFAFTLPAASVLSGLSQRIEAIRSGDLRPHTPVSGSGTLADEVTGLDSEIERLRADHARLKEQAAARGNEEALTALAALDERYRLVGERTDPPTNLIAVRAPVFLFFIAEELTRPFLPSYIESFAHPIAGLSIEVIISLPIVIFMAIVAVGQPVLNGVTERLGRARSLGIGALVALVGFVGTAFVGSMIELIVFRSLTALALATVFVASQGFIVDRTGPTNRARGIGLFVSAIMVAMVCGPPIGGVIADRIGTTAAFLVSAAMCLSAALCTLVALPDDPPGMRSRPPSLGFRQATAVLKQPVMLALLVGCALPAKMILIGFCFYFLPLSLSAQGYDSATIGHVLMLYGLMMVVLIPAISWVSDGGGRRVSYVVVGALLSGLAVVQLYLWPTPWGAALAVLQIGLAQGLSTTPQSALVGELGARYVPDLSQGGLYAMFRLVERAGTAIGPALVAYIWGVYGADVAIATIGAIVVFGGLLLTVTVLLAGTRTDRPAPAK